MDPRAWRRFRKNKGATVGAVLVVLVLLVTLVGPFLAPHDPDRQFSDAFVASGAPKGLGVTSKFRLGTDSVGRDELSRLLYGGRVSMQVAFFSTALAVFLGLAIGIGSGYFGGIIDSVSMRLVDVLLSLPFLLIAIAINRVINNPALWTMYVLLGVLSWTTLARVVRAKTMQIREMEYVQAARALGMSQWRIIWRHVLPNVMGPVIVIGTTLVAQMIIFESAMSFLGLGVQPPASTWGTMLNDGMMMIGYAPRLIVLPSVLIVATVFGFNLLGEGLRDALDPKE